MVYLFCAYREWALKLFKELFKKNKNFVLLQDPKKLTLGYVKKKNPKYIFFPDWSWKIPNEIVNNYLCICFHESDLPKFRGGSPIQNQIIRGIIKTKTTAFVMNEGIDKGDIILKKDLSLKGSLKDIFERMIENDSYMIKKIISGDFKRKKQRGRPSYFKRRKPADSELKTLNYSKIYLYNFVRMLADPYPNGFIKIGKRRVVFKSAKIERDNLICEVVIE